MWDILISKTILQMYTNSLGQYFDNLSLNAASCQTADCTGSVYISIESKLKDLKQFFHNQVLKMHWNCAILENAQFLKYFLYSFLRIF